MLSLLFNLHCCQVSQGLCLIDYFVSPSLAVWHSKHVRICSQFQTGDQLQFQFQFGTQFQNLAPSCSFGFNLAQSCSFTFNSAPSLEKNNLDVFWQLARNNPVRTLFLKGSFFGFQGVMGNRFPFCVGCTLFPFDPLLQTAFGHFLSSSLTWSQLAFGHFLHCSWCHPLNSSPQHWVWSFLPSSAFRFFSRGFLSGLCDADVSSLKNPFPRFFWLPQMPPSPSEWWVLTCLSSSQHCQQCQHCPGQQKHPGFRHWSVWARSCQQFD